MLKFQKRHTTVTRIWSKPQTQQVFKQLRAEGLTVNKINNGYEVVNDNNVLFLKAMNGTNSYLIRSVDFLLN
jgi:fructose-1,6-bisphosphatase/sedoheptulose 1,7-bisphosphatase-like protein